MRPSVVLVAGEVVMLGGRSDRACLRLDLATNSWSKGAALPQGHNLTCFPSVNWRDQAVFTFAQDCQLGIQSAVLDLADANWTAFTQPNSAVMPFALKLSQEDHGIEHLHMKSATVTGAGEIILVATGTKAGIGAQAGGLLLHFAVQTGGDPRFRLSFVKTQFFFPSILPRFLQPVRVVNDQVVMIQDKSDEGEGFEVFAVSLKAKRPNSHF